MMRKALIAILSILMLLIVSCSEYNIYREEISICRVGDTYFDTLQAAVDYIGSSRAISEDRTVYLLKDVLRNDYDDSIRKGVTVPATFRGDLRIDFQGNRYDFSSKEKYFFRFLGGDCIEVVNGTSVIFADSISTESALIVGTRTVTIDEHLIRDLRGTKKAAEVTKDGTLFIKAEDNAKAGFSGIVTITEGGCLYLKGGTYSITGITETGNADMKIHSGEVIFPHAIEDRINQAISAVPDEEKGEVITNTTHGPNFILHEAVAADCYHTGHPAYYECSICHKLFKDIGLTQETTLEELIIPKLTHSLVYHAAIAQTCTESGNREYWQCTLCSHYFSDEKAENEVLWSDIEIPSYGGHQYPDDWTVLKEATCTEDGLRTKTCLREGCGHVLEEVIPALDHTSDGKIYGQDDPDRHWYHCDIDDVDYGFADHTYGEWTESEAEGMQWQRECSVCHHIEYTPYEHIWEKVEAVEPTCTEDGNRGYWKCIFHEGEFTFDPDNPVSVSMEDIIISRTGHHPDHISRKEPTCTETGNVEYWYCPDCGSFFTDEECHNAITADRIILPALGHTFPMPPVISDYSHDDYDHWLYCERCKKEFHVSSSGSLTEGRQNHIWGEPEVCDDGLHYVRTCTVCGTIKNEDVPTDKKYEVSIGEITIRLPESPPCGDMTINGSVVADKGASVITDGTVRIGFAPHVNSNLNYSLACWYVRNGRTVYLDESDGTFSLTLSGPYQYTIVIQAYNEGGSISKEYSVRL